MVPCQPVVIPDAYRAGCWRHRESDARRLAGKSRRRGSTSGNETVQNVVDRCNEIITDQLLMPLHCPACMLFAREDGGKHHKYATGNHKGQR